jgi:hypothetical protein
MALFRKRLMVVSGIFRFITVACFHRTACFAKNMHAPPPCAMRRGACAWPAASKQQHRIYSLLARSLGAAQWMVYTNHSKPHASGWKNWCNDVDVTEDVVVICQMGGTLTWASSTMAGAVIIRVSPNLWFRRLWVTWEQQSRAQLAHEALTRRSCGC